MQGTNRNGEEGKKAKIINGRKNTHSRSPKLRLRPGQGGGDMTEAGAVPTFSLSGGGTLVRSIDRCGRGILLRSAA